MEVWGGNIYIKRAFCSKFLAPLRSDFLTGRWFGKRGGGEWHICFIHKSAEVHFAILCRQIY